MLVLAIIGVMGSATSLVMWLISAWAWRERCDEYEKQIRTKDETMAVMKTRLDGLYADLIAAYEKIRVLEGKPMLNTYNPALNVTTLHSRDLVHGPDLMAPPAYRWPDYTPKAEIGESTVNAEPGKQHEPGE